MGESVKKFSDLRIFDIVGWFKSRNESESESPACRAHSQTVFSRLSFLTFNFQLSTFNFQLCFTTPTFLKHYPFEGLLEFSRIQ